MVLALWKGNGLLTLNAETAKKWLQAHAGNIPYPEEKLDNFLNLYGKINDEKNLDFPFKETQGHREHIKKLNELRNQFTHFTPLGWSIELVGLPTICLDALEVVEFLGWKSNSFHWNKKVYAQRAKRALKLLRESMTRLNKIYDF